MVRKLVSEGRSLGCKSGIYLFFPYQFTHFFSPTFLLLWPTCSWDCSERRASRLWITFVRSRQSMQLLRNVPSWINITFPSASTRKYLNPYKLSYFWCTYLPSMVVYYYTNNAKNDTQSHLAFQWPCPTRSAGGATSSDCTPYGSQRLCTYRKSFSKSIVNSFHFEVPWIWGTTVWENLSINVEQDLCNLTWSCHYPS